MGFKFKLNVLLRLLFEKFPEIKKKNDAVRNDPHVLRVIDVMLLVRAWSSMKICGKDKDWGTKLMIALFEQRLRVVPKTDYVTQNNFRAYISHQQTNLGLDHISKDAARQFCQQNAMEEWLQLIAKTPGASLAELLQTHKQWRERHLSHIDNYVDESCVRLIDYCKKESIPLPGAFSSQITRRLFLPYNYGSTATGRMQKLADMAEAIVHGNEAALQHIFPNGATPLSDNGFWQARIPSSLTGREAGQMLVNAITKGNRKHSHIETESMRVLMPGMTVKKTNEEGQSVEETVAMPELPEGTDPEVAKCLPAIVLLLDKREHVSPLKNAWEPRPRFSMFAGEPDYEETHKWLSEAIRLGDSKEFSDEPLFHSHTAQVIPNFQRVLDTPALSRLLYRVLGIVSARLLQMDVASPVRARLKGYTIFYDGFFYDEQDRIAANWLPRAIRLHTSEAAWMSREDILKLPRLANHIGEGDFTAFAYMMRLMPNGNERIKLRCSVESIDTDSICYAQLADKFVAQKRRFGIAVVSKDRKGIDPDNEEKLLAAKEVVWNMDAVGPLVEKYFNKCNGETLWGYLMLAGTDFVPHCSVPLFPIEKLIDSWILPSPRKPSIRAPAFDMAYEPVDPATLLNPRVEFKSLKLKRPIMQMGQENFDTFVDMFLDAVRMKYEVNAESKEGPWYYEVKTGRVAERRRDITIEKGGEPITRAHLQAVYRRIRTHLLMFFFTMELFDEREFGLQVAPNGESVYGFMKADQKDTSLRPKIVFPATVHGGSNCLFQQQKQLLPAAASAKEVKKLVSPVKGLVLVPNVGEQKKFVQSTLPLKPKNQEVALTDTPDDDDVVMVDRSKSSSSSSAWTLKSSTNLELVLTPTEKKQDETWLPMTERFLNGTLPIRQIHVDATCHPGKPCSHVLHLHNGEIWHNLKVQSLHVIKRLLKEHPTVRPDNAPLCLRPSPTPVSPAARKFEVSLQVDGQAAHFGQMSWRDMKEVQSGASPLKRKQMKDSKEAKADEDEDLSDGRPTKVLKTNGSFQKKAPMRDVGAQLQSIVKKLPKEEEEEGEKMEWGEEMDF